MCNARATKRQFEAELARHPGAALDVVNSQFALVVDAPQGKVWKSCGIHCMVEEFDNGFESFKPKAYAEMIDRMKDGTEDCQEPDCDICQGY